MKREVRVANIKESWKGSRVIFLVSWFCDALFKFLKFFSGGEGFVKMDY